MSSSIGVIRAGVADDDPQSDANLRRIQSDLFNIGSCLAAWRNTPAFECVVQISDEDIRFLESSIDEIQDALPELKGFLLPAGHPTSAWTHFARAVCRRAERKVVRLSVEMKVGRPPRQLRGIMVYLNRLSDYLFALGRHLNFKHRIADDVWAA